MMISIRTITLVALVSIAVAQDLSELSAKCNTTLSTLSNNPEITTCLGLKNLETIALQVMSNSSSSLIPAVDTWINGVCGAEVCTENTLKIVAQSLADGCDAEIPDWVITDFPIFRNVLCIKEGSENCITQTLNIVEATLGTVDPSVGTLNINTLNLISEGGIPTILYTSNVLCTECNKAMLTTVVKSYPELKQTVAESVGYVCNASYNDGVVSPKITLATAAASETGAAAGSVAVGASGETSTVTSVPIETTAASSESGEINLNTAAGASKDTSAAFDIHSTLVQTVFTAAVISGVAVVSILA